MSNDAAVTALISDPELQKRLAKHIALHCFRNSELENLHAGIVPASKIGDFTDVVVRTPFGEIPWNELSRIDDAEMKTLMLDVVSRTYQLVQELFDEQRGGDLLLKLAGHDPQPRWDDPEKR